MTSDKDLRGRVGAPVDDRNREEFLVEEARGEIEIYRKGEAEICVVDGQKPIQGASVSVDQISHEFLFGCNIYMFDRFKGAEENRAYRERFLELFNYATTGFYWRSYEPVPGQPQYEYTDKVVRWCERHGIRVKGHPLLWDHEAGRPLWADGEQPSAELQRRRVKEIIRRYRERIEFWEVVNEPSHCSGIEIDEPYRWAREADPKAKLILNDYHILADGHPPFFDLLRQAKMEGVPFDGIGIQAHEPRTMRFPLNQVRRVLDTYATLGKPLHITEFTPASGGQRITGSYLEGSWNEARQADYAEKFYTLCFSHPAVVAITWWDLCDRHSWLPGGGMLRSDLSAKPVYTRLWKLIHQEWHTRAKGRTDAHGCFRFRGFFGTYRARIRYGPRSLESTLRLSRRSRRARKLVHI